MNLLKNEKQIALGGHSIFLVLAAMSIWFWQERTLILDAAFQSYLLICEGEPAIMVQRFGIVPIQLLPLLGVWLGFSLPKVLILFSLSYVLFQWFLFSVSLYKLRNGKAALAIVLFNILLTGDCFYWMQNELLPAISLLFVLIALAERQSQSDSPTLFRVWSALLFLWVLCWFSFGLTKIRLFQGMN
jgi:hypothetical protein